MFLPEKVRDRIRDHELAMGQQIRQGAAILSCTYDSLRSSSLFSPLHTFQRWPSTELEALRRSARTAEFVSGTSRGRSGNVAGLGSGPLRAMAKAGGGIKGGRMGERTFEGSRAMGARMSALPRPAAGALVSSDKVGDPVAASRGRPSLCTSCDKRLRRRGLSPTGSGSNDRGDAL